MEEREGRRENERERIKGSGGRASRSEREKVHQLTLQPRRSSGALYQRVTTTGV